MAPLPDQSRLSHAYPRNWPAPKLLPFGERWPVKRTNSWFTNFGQRRRSTDRRNLHRLAMMALAAALILVVKLFLWADRFPR